MTNTAGLKRGNPGNAGGGRHPWIFRDEMQQALREGHAAQVVKKIIAGDLMEVIGVSKDGEPIVGQTKNADRLKAIQLAASYAIGLPVQPTIDITPKDPTALAADALLQAIPRMLTVLDVSIQQKAKLLQAVEVDAEIVS